MTATIPARGAGRDGRRRFGTRPRADIDCFDSLSVNHLDDGPGLGVDVRVGLSLFTPNERDREGNDSPCREIQQRHEARPLRLAPAVHRFDPFGPFDSTT